VLGAEGRVFLGEEMTEVEKEFDGCSSPTQNKQRHRPPKAGAADRSFFAGFSQRIYFFFPQEGVHKLSTTLLNVKARPGEFAKAQNTRRG
jgi:hypothetical protein